MLFVPRYGLSQVLIDYEPSASVMKVRMGPEEKWHQQRISAGTARTKIRRAEWVPVHPELTVERGL